jgi:hypothetical protein
LFTSLRFRLQAPNQHSEEFVAKHWTQHSAFSMQGGGISNPRHSVQSFHHTCGWTGSSDNISPKFVKSSVFGSSAPIASSNATALSTARASGDSIAFFSADRIFPRPRDLTCEPTRSRYRCSLGFFLQSIHGSASKLGFHSRVHVLVCIKRASKS